jgi:S-adenosylmethionine:tRNA ribosyltransferase-isomerase
LPKEHIKRKVEPEDEERYQTVFAKTEGAVAAPSAGLHFSKVLLKKLEIKGLDLAYLTLHTGLGNFKPVEVEDLTKHKTDSEQLIIPEETVKKVNKAKDNKKKVCAVGTTVMRAIETSVSTTGHLKPFNGWTNKFIFPPYDFSIATSMLTGFHKPESILLMQVAAFAGHELLMEAYKKAIKDKYKFLTYGDSMLIL